MLSCTLFQIIINSFIIASGLESVSQVKAILRGKNDDKRDKIHRYFAILRKVHFILVC